ncbi:YabP/YqfC family sporulation protein [Candidatus Epulonipiscium viviparus]|uniref:YabP/YqfC family sporulation protein n=1 Tax=Candidatus Epulonipiscium viviparus TaxID=420336 RepID=UPI00016C0F16|nr:YabP/YqfC family sporulation protein [Candidatus Epulopiscium viviparus]
MSQRLTIKELTKTFKNFISSIDGVEESIIGLPLITIIGEDNLRVENFSSIIEYNQEIIRLKTKIGVISIIGKNLLAKSMTKEEIVIRGKISGVNLN